MKYSYMLLITLIITITWGLLLFILGFVLRFQQAMLVNRYIEGLADSVNLKVCEKKGEPMDINLCATKLAFDSISLGDWADWLGSTVIVTGFLILFFSASGFVGVIKKSQALLLLMLVVIIGAIGMEYYVLDITVSSAKDSSFHKAAMEELKEKVMEHYTLQAESNDFTRMLNALMLQGECCGISGPNDFALNETIKVGMHRHTLKIPPACCIRDEFGSTDSAAGFRDLLSCVDDPLSSTVKTNQQGCYETIQREVYDSYGGIVIGFITFLIVWEGLQGILVFMIILRPTPKTARKSLTASLGSGGRPGDLQAQATEAAKKKFIPYSKVSSAITTDINRIKSTEIW